MEIVTKRKSVTLQPDYFNAILRSDSVKTCLLLCFKFLYFLHYYVYEYLKDVKNTNIGNLKILPSW